MTLSDSLISRIGALLSEKRSVTVAIDGRAASGKTTLAAKLARRFDAAVVHMDDFFLRPGQRTPERLAEPGGNVDRERVLAEVLLPLSRGEKVVFRPYDCQTASLKEEIALPEKRLVIVEGSYSLHPELRPFYDLAVFVTTDAKTQLERVEARSPDKLAEFRDKWIVLEERYFAAFDTARNCDVIIET